MTKTIYMAYGSNMNKRHMAQRCPAAKAVGKLLVPGFRLAFKGVADMIEAPGFGTPVALWELTPDCERALDAYEGYRAEAPKAGLYRKRYWSKKGDDTRYMAYVMNLSHFGPPSQVYYDTIAQGYRDFGLSLDHLNEALQHSYDEEMADPYVSRKWG